MFIQAKIDIQNCNIIDYVYAHMWHVILSKNDLGVFVSYTFCRRYENMIVMHLYPISVD